MSEKHPVSSAEYTAIWRSTYPSISHDPLSCHLVSEEAIKQANDFKTKHDYPLIDRKIGARAGYIFTQAVNMINHHDCDSVISFASGFSMLTFLIGEAADKDVLLYDTDLEDILEMRQSRYSNLPLSDEQTARLSRIHHVVLDIEETRSNDLQLSECFPKCKRPVIIVEGLTYFLQPETRDWFIDQLATWNGAHLIVEYWPENALTVSEKLKKSFENDINENWKEDLKCFLLDQNIEDLKKHFTVNDISVAEAEAMLSRQADEAPELLDPNSFYPIRILTATPQE